MSISHIQVIPMFLVMVHVTLLEPQHIVMDFKTKKERKKENELNQADSRDQTHNL